MGYMRSHDLGLECLVKILCSLVCFSLFFEGFRKSMILGLELYEVCLHSWRSLVAKSTTRAFITQTLHLVLECFDLGVGIMNKLIHLLA